MVLDWAARTWLWYLSIAIMIGVGSVSVIGIFLGWDQPPWVTALMIAGTVGFAASIELQQMHERLSAIEETVEGGSAES